jgi:hypothetical protein
MLCSWVVLLRNEKNMATAAFMLAAAETIEEYFKNPALVRPFA